MKTVFLVGGPLVVALVAFSIWSGIIYFGEIKGSEYETGTEAGVTVDAETESEPVGYSQSANYRLEEQQTGFSDVNGLEVEQEAIEYREGLEEINKTKQPGLAKYTNINFRWPTGLDTENWRFIFEEKE